MYILTATAAKQKFREAVERSRDGPVAIQRHGETIAVIASPSAISNGREQKLLALEQQKQIEANRLIRHQRIAIHLMADPDQAQQHIEAARQVVDRWERESLCSDHYISRWRKVLSLPVRDLAIAMSGEMDGWGNALRQNSPWRITP